MNWPDEVVEKAIVTYDAHHVGEELASKQGMKAALAAITPQDIAKLPEVKALLEATDATVERWDGPLWKDLPNTAVYIHKLRKALEPFTEVSNEN